MHMHTDTHINTYTHKDLGRLKGQSEIITFTLDTSTVFKSL